MGCRNCQEDLLCLCHIRGHFRSAVDAGQLLGGICLSVKNSRLPKSHGSTEGTAIQFHSCDSQPHFLPVATDVGWNYVPCTSATTDIWTVSNYFLLGNIANSGRLWSEGSPEMWEGGVWQPCERLETPRLPTDHEISGLHRGRPVTQRAGHQDQPASTACYFHSSFFQRAARPS